MPQYEVKSWMQCLWLNVTWFLHPQGWWWRTPFSTGFLHLYRYWRWSNDGFWEDIVQWNFLRRYELLTVMGRYDKAGELHQKNLRRRGHAV